MQFKGSWTFWERHSATLADKQQTEGAAGMKRLWISMTVDKSWNSSGQASALNQLSRVYDEQLSGPVRWRQRWCILLLTCAFVPHSRPAPLSSQCQYLSTRHPARQGCWSLGSRGCRRRRCAAETAPPSTCAVATPGRRLQSPPPPPPGSAVTSCSCFPVGRVGLTFESVFSCREGSAGAN